MLAEGFELAPDFLDFVQSEREKVRGVMKTEIATVAEDTPLTDIAKLMVAGEPETEPVAGL